MKSFKDYIDFVFQVCKEEVETGIRDEKKHKEMLNAYREAQKIAWGQKQNNIKWNG